MTDQKNAIKTDARKLLVLLRVLMLLCAVGILWSAVALISGKWEYAQGDAAYEQVRSMLENGETAAGGGSPGIASNRAASIDFASLQKTNQDAAAWIFAEGSAIDYPIVQGEDNEYYLTHLFNGAENKLGSLFIDYRSSRDFSDKNTVIYGHNMKDGSMFSSLTQYKDQSYYDSLPQMLLYTPDEVYTIELFAGIVADGSYDFVRLGFNDDADFLTYIETLKAGSTFQSNITVEAQDRIVTLCTCSYEFNNARYALFGKLVAMY